MSSSTLEVFSREAIALALPHRAASPERYIAVGRSDHPRWLLPEGHKLTDDAFLGWGPYRAGSRLAWTGAKTLLRWGGSAGLAACGSKRVNWNFDCDWRALGWSNPADPVLLIYLGTPGERRKAVLHLLNSQSGVCELIVKVPLTTGAASAIAREAATLRSLERQGFTAAPRLVQYDGGRHVSSQTVMQGVRCGMKFNREVADLLQLLQLPGQTTILAETAHELIQLKNRLNLSEAADSLITSAITELHDGTVLPAYRIHGDFAPWNIRLSLGGAAALVDWEAARPYGLPLHDAFHFAHMTRSLFNRNPQPAFPNMPCRTSASLSLALCRKLEIAFIAGTLLQQFSSRSPRKTAYFTAALCQTLATRA